MSTAERRLEDLEVKLAHLERGLNELSDVVVRQQQELEQFAARNQHLSQQLSLLAQESGASATAIEKPPHY
jgi:uncharacterized coiled-coil protein SlyX